jgi:hypothetical protein
VRRDEAPVELHKEFITTVFGRVSYEFLNIYCVDTFSFLRILMWRVQINFGSK